MSVVAVSTFEWVKAMSPIGAAFVAIVGAAFVTTTVTHRYEKRRKQHDFDLETMQELASLYGQIFGVWKAWDSRCRFPKVDPADHAAWELLAKAVDAEGRLEALLLRIAADRYLRDEDIKVLAGLRQSFKVVRKAIREDEPIGWRSGIDRRYAH